jgi:hypothetical protein
LKAEELKRRIDGLRDQLELTKAEFLRRLGYLEGQIAAYAEWLAELERCDSCREEEAE